MPLLKFNVRWEDDMNVLRDIEILHSHSFLHLHQEICKAFSFAAGTESEIYVSNDFWHKGQALASDVEKNIRGAAFLSMQKTPIGAFLTEQNQKFIYVPKIAKKWELQIELISINEEPKNPSLYPRCVRTEGISPAQFGTKNIEKDVVMEVEEKYDLSEAPEGEEQDEGEDGNDLGFGDSMEGEDFDHFDSEEL